MKSKRVPALVVLAAGALLGWLAASGNVPLGRPAQAAASQEVEEVITFVVRLPADAVLEIDGSKTTSTGESRTFRTPPLKVGGRYAYDLKATAGGKEVTRKVHLAHGADNSFDLRAEFRPAGTSKAGAPQLHTVGYPQAAPGSAAARSGAGEQAPERAKDESALLKNAEAFVEAFHKGDAKALAAFWTPDGDYTDQTGRQMKGREAIEKAFQGFFADNKGLKLRIDIASLRFVTPDVAVEDGTTSVIPPDGGPPSRARYAIVHVKKNDQWLLSSVRDAPFAPPGNYENLRQLEWAIGDWATEEGKGEVARFSFAWAENQNFITSTFTTTFKNISIGGGTQWIGWDPAAKQLRSWTFDANGGFSEGSWTRDGSTKWVVTTKAVLPEGKKAVATLVVTRLDADTIGVQSKDRAVDGAKVPDTKEIKLKRVK
jgi:uncharacterized protein (TIGR02246 family)